MGKANLGQNYFLSRTVKEILTQCYTQDWKEKQRDNLPLCYQIERFCWELYHDGKQEDIIERINKSNQVNKVINTKFFIT